MAARLHRRLTRGLAAASVWPSLFEADPSAAELSYSILSFDHLDGWARDDHDAGRELLFHNPSHVFFRTIRRVPSDQSPQGAMNRSITTLPTVAVDPGRMIVLMPIQRAYALLPEGAP